MVNLPSSEKKKTLIFDLDETLIHTVDDPYSERCDILTVIRSHLEEETIQIGFNIRPHL